MTLDPRHFSPMLVADTCSVWNMLSARKLYQAAKTANLTFLITSVVWFECAVKRRNSLSEEKQELFSRLKKAKDDGGFAIESCSLEDLYEVSKIAPRGLGDGEISCIALVRGLSSLAFMTDERKARKFAESRLGQRVETTPRMYGWLCFHNYLGEFDHDAIISEHERFESRPLTKYFEIAKESALIYRLRESTES